MNVVSHDSTALVAKLHYEQEAICNVKSARKWACPVQKNITDVLWQQVVSSIGGLQTLQDACHTVDCKFKYLVEG